MSSRDSRSMGWRGAFSLAELILTLALAVMLMAMVGTAMSFYATKLDVRDSEVRRVQLAQAILGMLAEDLQSAIHPPEFDDAALATLLASSTGGGGGGAASGGGEDLSAAGLGDTSDMSSTSLDLTGEVATSMESTDLGMGTAATSRPGLMGNQTQIQFDVSRLPRLEEYQPVLSGESITEITDIPSDIKTVTYYVQPPGGGVTDPLALPGTEGAFPDMAAAGGGGVAPLGAGGASSGGLVRRSLDRAMTQWAMQNGGLASLSATGDLVATEVASIQFQYWDGTMWQMYWDSDQQGGLPLAVKVTLTMVEPSLTEPTAAGTPTAPATRVYEQLIRLPMARPSATQTTTGLSAAGL